MYALIIIVLTYQGSGATIGRFDSLQACETAARWVNAQGLASSVKAACFAGAA